MSTTPRSAPEVARSRATAGALLLITVLVVASALRAPITSVGSVLGSISVDTGLDEAQLGLLGAIPLAAFAVVSPLVHMLARRIGSERAVLLALIVLAIATALRSLPGWNGWLWVGTAILGSAIAVGNVLVPALVKKDFPHRIAISTGAYSAVLSGFAALASGFASPIAARFGWRIAIGVWSVLAVVAALVWLPRVVGATRLAQPASSPAASRTMWSSWTAWQVALFMAAQSTTFYLIITWLPTVEVKIGQTAITAGWHLFVFQVVGIVAGLLVPLAMHGRGDLRGVAVGVSVLMVMGMTGLLLAPALILLWIVLCGASAGAALVIALTFVAQRARSAVDARSLSGMAQGVGYFLASLGPLGAGLLLQLTHAWEPVIIAAGLVACLQIVVALFAGRDRQAHAHT